MFLNVILSAADVPKPRYVRVNTIKLDVESAIQELSKQNKVSSALCLTVAMTQFSITRVYFQKIT